MKYSNFSFKLRVLTSTTFVATITAVLFLTQSLAAQVTLTGAVIFSTDASGNPFNGSIWDTAPGNNRSDLFFINGANYSSGAFINGPTDSQVGINIPLTAGNTYIFSFMAGAGGFTANHALNLFFNGDNVNPGISVFGLTETNGFAIPSFAPNASSSTYSLVSGTVPGANSASYLSGNTLVTLTSYAWAEPTIYNVDRVSAPFGSPGYVGADGNLDWVGQITLNVTTVPEPAPIAIIILGLFVFITGRKLKVVRSKI